MRSVPKINHSISNHKVIRWSARFWMFETLRMNRSGGTQCWLDFSELAKWLTRAKSVAVPEQGQVMPNGTGYFLISSFSSEHKESRKDTCDCLWAASGWHRQKMMNESEKTRRVWMRQNPQNHNFDSTFSPPWISLDTQFCERFQTELTAKSATRQTEFSHPKVGLSANSNCLPLSVSLRD